jgi:hypothetical protein
MIGFFNIHHLRTCCAISALAFFTGTLPAQEPAAFTPPKSHPVSRYEAMWETNPFTLETTLIVVQNASFAENLVIASVYGNLADPTVVLVNVKTHERIRLRMSQAARNGMKLDRLHMGSRKRDDILAIVSRGAETSEVHFGTAYLKQVAAAGTTRATQSVLQKRQHSLSQHSGTVTPATATLQQQAMSSSAAPNAIPVAAPRQDAGLVSGSFNPTAGANPRSSQTGPTHNDSHSSMPSLAEDLSGAAQLSLRRYNFRSGDELFIPHPDPQ